ncbi:QcrA and Rieske domain-containing protein [Mucilaginibacter lappiensis]|uniref:Cytochrome b6-f complex iron-sulfur subunit n=1 Tax=Mucilaginibacter lappiensis TaxID=354630 RepID=A0A1N6NC46_9SPHI|nr:Rieske 2Fe-2S domain-containing protein [Mucilaginibacter lappiensis]MBB6108012.1 cytochrome b6-f complex iron-sulfur subunit [Mucilaginibacter lappiensis]MBB6125916.1 cytochrome b6-f complex iron-sulfur subunit [Mucilaginibacter lappiensis]SIP89635.1 cytochrome b6-f complex iron-sulfur subunit [Mucilaginibacter lappiensis]
MDRKEFLSAIGLTAASFALINCAGCSKKSDNGTSGVNGPSDINFTLDLTISANAALLTNGGYLASNGVIVAKTTAGTYVAVQQSCTHQSYPLIYQGSNQQFYCNNHGSAFTEAGVVKNSPANRNLTVYQTTLTGSSLRVFS